MAAAMYCLSIYLRSTSAVADYERGYRAWQAQRERDRLDDAKRESEAAERQRLANLERQAERTLKARRGRLKELESIVLRAQAEHALGVDFFGTGGPAALLAGFRRHLAQLKLADLGLLRESRHPAIVQLVGDGATMPPLPPPGTPFTDPFMTMGEYYHLLEDSS